MIRSLKGRVPAIHQETYIDQASQVIGDVRIARNVSVWPGAVLRGDDHNYIEIGEGSNVQDGCIGHVTAGSPLLIGKHVTIGHGAILHACTIEDEARIGMGAIVLDGAVVGKGAQVGAGALVTAGKKIPKESLAVGVPAKVIRDLTKEEKAKMIANALEYVELWKRDYKDVVKNEMRE